MKLKSRARRVSTIIKREDFSLQPNASSEARASVSDATLSVKQKSKSCTLIEQEEEPFISAPDSNDMQEDPDEEMDMAIKQEETSETKADLGKYVDKLQRQIN